MQAPRIASQITKQKLRISVTHTITLAEVILVTV